jgi:predicted PurR-regulated permease PerM
MVPESYLRFQRVATPPLRKIKNCMPLFDRKTLQILLTVLAFSLLVAMLYLLRELFFLLLISLFFAYTLEPLTATIYRLTPSNVSHRTAVFVTFLLVTVVSILGLMLLGQTVLAESTLLIQQMPTLDQDPTTATEVPLPSQLEPFREQIRQFGLGFSRSAVETVVGSIGNATLLLLAPVFAFFILLDGPGYRNAIVQLAARGGHQIWVTALMTDLRRLVSSYVRALFLQSLTVLLVFLVFFHLVGLPYAVLLATLAAALEIIPILGWIGASLITLAVAAYAHYPHVWWLVIFFLVFRVFQDYVVTPYVMKRGVELPAIAVLLGILAGEMIGGVRGVFLAIPTLATLRVLYRHFARRVTLFSAMLVLTIGAQAHSISVSTTSGTLTGQQLQLQLRIPKYEAENIAHTALTGAIQFTGATPQSASCATVDQELVCDIAYQFSQPPGEKLASQVTLARVTVPNHVHIMRLTRGETVRQAVFDRTFETGEIDFHEVGKAELWWRSSRMGISQLLYQPILLLLLLVITRPAAYLVGGVAAFLIVLPDKFYAVPGFFELATAISLTYVAVETLFFADAKGKWLIAAAIGALEGASLAVLARPSGPGAVPFGLGNLAAAFVVSQLASHFSRNIPATHLRKLLWALSAIGVCWSIWVFVKRF